MTVDEILAGDLAEWGPGRRRMEGPAGVLWLTFVLGAPVLLVAFVLSFLVHWAAGPVAALALGAVVAWWLRSQAGAGLRAVDSRPLDPGAAPRLANVVRGLAQELGIEAPALQVVEEGGPNALVGRSPGSVLAVSRSLLDTYTRTELEGVVAHCLLRLNPAVLRRSALAGALGEVAGPAGTLNLEELDARAAAMTRYPPGLAAAIEKASPHAGRGASFWFVPDGRGHGAPETRAALLRDL